MKQEPIIIVRKRVPGRHAPHGGGAWKVAYADFVTALMAFFLVMWIVGQNAATRAALAAYFRDPVAFEYSRTRGVMPSGAAGLNRTDMSLPADVEQARAILQHAAEQLREALQALPEFASLKERIQIELTPEGLRIELLETPTDSFFEVGSSTLKPAMVKLLGVIATQLGRLPNPVAVEGHTDSRPYVDQRFSNWELSTDRANGARRVMQDNGLTPHQVEAVRGYADTRLRYPEDPFDHRNRRISIIVRRSDRADVR